MSTQEGQQPQARATSAMEDSAHEPEPGRPLSSHQEMRVDAASDSRPNAWVIAVALLGVVAIVSPWLLPRGVEIAALCVVAIMLLLVVVRPQWALFIFILALPLHNLLMGVLFHLPGSESFVKLMQPWKEVVVAVALARAVLPIVYRALRRQPRMTAWLRVTPLDLLVILMVALAGASVLLPSHLVTFAGRLYGFRDLAMPFAVFAIGRLAPLSRRDVRIVVGLIALDSVAFAVGAIGERALWGNGLLLAVDYGTYIHRFLGVTSTLPYNTPFTFYTDGFFPRAGS